MNLSFQVNVKNFLSKAVVCIVVIAWLGTFFNIKKYHSQNLIDNDIVSYYAYLPALFMEHDLSLKFLDDHTREHPGKYWPETAPNGGKVIKTTMGLAILYLPFFAAGHIAALIFGEPANAFSKPYYFFLCLGTIVYSFIGLLVLRKLLLSWFSDGITALALASVYLGTNLFYYTVHEPLMSHAYIFFLSVLYLKSIIAWHQKPSVKNAVLLGTAAGLMILIRPMTVLFLVIFILYNVRSRKTLIEKIKFIFQNRWQVGLMAFLIFILFLPQMIYWKSLTGNWLFNSYQNERFYFNHSHLMEALFGYRKGWLLYTPVMIFSLAGLFFLKKNIPQFALSLPLFVMINIYVLSCWWAWWFGGSFGNRGYIDMYALLSLSMSSCFSWLFTGKRWKRVAISTVGILLICFQLFETIQYHYGVIHHDGMTKKAYFISFMKIHTSKEFYDALRKPDYENAKAGLPERELIYD